MKKLFLTVFLSFCIAAFCVFYCRRSNNLLLGKVEASVGTHQVAVTDCYRLSVPPPERLPDTEGGQAAYRFAPCRDAEVVIRGEDLEVNGRHYGLLNKNDSVTVDHGQVLVNDRDASPTSK
ncbi:MAG: hypothetical protein DMF61_24685 [Blastocatellia bacterium AA13]|nr:MAG: hypothetical protein DMF61_24685 [Blastocatellia bacterium AA13]